MNKFRKEYILDVKDLSVSINNQKIINKFDLQIRNNECHVIMGPNGSGKSTLSKVLAGHPSYNVNNGTAFFNGKNLLDLNPEERSYEGLFLAFQYPIEIPGVSNYDFLREIYNIHCKKKGLPLLDPIEFFNIIKTKMDLINMNENFLKRNINEGFSGGEKKRNELLQLLLLQPKLIILDEIDSGLDIDSMILFTKIINQELFKNCSLLVISHYNRFLEYLRPNFVHIMQKGEIIKTGDSSLAEVIENKGFTWINSEKRND